MALSISLADTSYRISGNRRAKGVGAVHQEVANDEEVLNRRWRRALMAFFLRRVRNHTEAEDLTQEVFVRMLKSASDGGQPDVYVFQIAANLLVDRSRKLKVRERHRESIAADDLREIDALDPHSVAEGREQFAALVAALEELPERTRAIFILFRMENISQEAIGESYGISASAVKQQVAKAMAHVMKRMRGVR